MNIINEIKDLIRINLYYAKETPLNIKIENKVINYNFIKLPLFKIKMLVYAKRPAAYIIINSWSGEFYIGSSGNIKNRIVIHRAMLNTNKNVISQLQKSFNNTNSYYFDVCIIFTNDREQAYDLEQYLVDELKNISGFLNTALNVRAPHFGLKMSANKNRSEEAKRNRALAQIGKKHSDKTKEKMSLAHKGKQPSNKALLAAQEKLNKQIIINDILYKSYKEATKALNVSKNTIRRRIKAGWPGYNYIGNN